MNLRACLYFAFKIKDGLFIGDINSPNEKDFLVSNKITCVVNCAASQIKPVNLNLGIKFISFDWLDNDDQIIIDDSNDNMQLIYEFMNRAYENCESVLVCSVRGQSRALTVITAFLMKRYLWSLYKTLEYMNSKRADFEIRATFLKQLLSYEQKLFGAKGCSRNWKDDHSSPDYETSLVRNTYVNSQMICVESRDFYMRSIASRASLKPKIDYMSLQKSTKLKWSTQLKMEIPHEDLQSIAKKQNTNTATTSNTQNGNQNTNNAYNTSSNQSMKNSSNWTASNSSNQMDSVEILPIKENTFQAPKKSILKAVSAYEKKANNNSNNNNSMQTSLQIVSDEVQSQNSQNQNQKKKEARKPPMQKNQSYDLIEEQNEEYEQSSSEIFISKSKLRSNQQSPSPLKMAKPLNDLEKELLIDHKQNEQSSNDHIQSAINANITSENSSDLSGQETNNRLNASSDEVLPVQKQPILKQRNEIKIFESNIDKTNKTQTIPPAPPTNGLSQIQKSDFQLQKEKKKNNYFVEENNQLPQEIAPKSMASEIKTQSASANSANNITEEVRIIAVEENDNNENSQIEPYKLNYQQINESIDKKSNYPPRGGSGGGYQILNDQQIKNSMNLAQYQINSRLTQSTAMSQPGSNNSSRQTTPTRKYRKSPFPMALPQRKIIQSQTAPSSNQNSRKNSLASVDQIIQQYPQQMQGQQQTYQTDKRQQNTARQYVSKSPDSSQLQVNINLNINSVNILNQTTNPLYQRQKSPADNESQNINLLQNSQGKNIRKVSRPPQEAKKRPNTEKVYTEGNQVKDLDFLKPSSTRLTRRLQTYTNGDPLTFLPNITFMRQRTPLKNNINLPNTQNMPIKQQKNLELSFQDISATPNNNNNAGYLQPMISQNPNSQQMYTNYLNDVDISSQQNTTKSSSTNKHKGFKREYTPLLRAKISIPSPYQNHENRSSSTFDQRRISTETGQGRGTDLGKHKRSVSRGKEKDLNSTFSYLNTSNNNSGANTPSNDMSINNQLYTKYGKAGFKPSYNKLLY